MGVFASKKFLVGAGMIVALCIGIAIYGEPYRIIGGDFKWNTTTPPTSNSMTRVVKEVVSESGIGNNHGTSNENKAISNVVRVTRVIDGDTIEIEGGERVRYIGIDTPETVDPRKSVQCFGVEASAKNKEMVLGKMVRLEKDRTDRDKYHRLLRYVWVDDVLVNLELVKQGFAYSYSYPPDIQYQDRLVRAQQEAREAKRGLWNLCPAALPTQTAIPATQENNSGGSCVIKGNISPSGEKIYHAPGCASYEKTRIDEGRGEKWFCNESEALDAGWRKALNCQ